MPEAPKVPVATPPEKLIKRIDEMLQKASGNTEILGDGAKVNPEGIAKFIGSMHDIVIMLQRAHVKQVWEYDQDVWDHISQFEHEFPGESKLDPVKLGFSRICSDYDDVDGELDEYDVDKEPQFVAAGEILWHQASSVKTNLAGVKVDFGPYYGHGTFTLDGADPKNPKHRGYLHAPGDSCVSQTIKGATWEE